MPSGNPGLGLKEIGSWLVITKKKKLAFYSYPRKQLKHFHIFYFDLKGGFKSCIAVRVQGKQEVGVSLHVLHPGRKFYTHVRSIYPAHKMWPKQSHSGRQVENFVLWHKIYTMAQNWVLHWWDTDPTHLGHNLFNEFDIRQLWIVLVATNKPTWNSKSKELLLLNVKTNVSWPLALANQVGREGRLRNSMHLV
jgi:hypothetical protein